MAIDFKQFTIRESLLQTLHKQGISTPTPIQKEALPVLLDGADLIGQAQTGTGKTLAFVLPILERIDVEQAYIQALIIAPTRELALQITEELEKYAPAVDANVLAVYGGQDVERQIRKLQGQTHVVVGTPGRLLDHLRRGTIDFSGLSILVLDEADQMLHMGFLDEVEELVHQLPANRQTILFSATMPKSIRTLASRYMQSAQEIRIEPKRVTLDEIRQVVVETTDRQKQDALYNLIKEYQPFLAIVFCRTKRRASTLNAALIQRGIESDELHGDLSQSKREQVMKRFREAQIQILVATDVAARGLDVEGVTHVFNYDIPHDIESYIHRIGRTGRAGEEGVAVTFVAPRDRDFLRMIETGIRTPLEKRIENTGAETRSNREGTSRRPSGGRRKRAETEVNPRRRTRETEGNRREATRETEGNRRETTRERESNRGRSGPKMETNRRSGQSEWTNNGRKGKPESSSNGRKGGRSSGRGNTNNRRSR